MIKLIGVLALSAISLSALAGDIKTKHKVTVKIDGKLECSKQDLFTGYIPTIIEQATLSIVGSDIQKVLLLNHDDLQARSRVLDLCRKLAELPLDSGSVVGRLDISVSTRDLQDSDEATKNISETVRLTLPNGVVLNSSAHALIK